MSARSRWTAADIPSQKGRTIIITGTGGLGFEDALALCRVGAKVILAGRNADKGAASVARIKAAVAGAEIGFEALDLASLASVAAFAGRMRGGRIDVLINNAAVMAPPKRLETADGFDLQFGTNYLGHFALTGRLLPMLRGARVVNVCSIADRNGAIVWDDLQSRQRYVAWAAYSQSKLANLMFAQELQRRSAARGWGLQSLAAHPGISRTDLVVNGAGRMSLIGMATTVFGPLISQPAAQGALPTLYAATSAEAVGGGYYGPDGMGGMRGYPAPSAIASAALDEGLCGRLWAEAERLTGVTYG